MKVEIKFEANLEETQDLEMVRKICQVIGANPVTVKTTDVKKSVPAQDVKKPAPAPAPVPKRLRSPNPCRWMRTPLWVLTPLSQFRTSGLSWQVRWTTTAKPSGQSSLNWERRM